MAVCKIVLEFEAGLHQNSDWLSRIVRGGCTAVRTPGQLVCQLAWHGCHRHAEVTCLPEDDGSDSRGPLSIVADLEEVCTFRGSDLEGDLGLDEAMVPGAFRAGIAVYCNDLATDGEKFRCTSDQPFNFYVTVRVYKDELDAPVIMLSTP